MINHIDFDFEGRKTKANKILSIIKEFKNLDGARILDIGVGSGIITSEIGESCKWIYGIDVIDERTVRENYKFLRASGTVLPFKSKSFDIIISNHVIEHVDNQRAHVDEIHRVLSDGGMCYMACPNKFWILEPHYKIPFLAILPKKLANVIVKSLNRGQYSDVRLLDFKNLKTSLMDFDIKNFTFEVMKNPYKYSAEDIPFHQFYFLYRLIPMFVFNLINYFLPSWILLLTKKKTAKQ